MKKDTSPIKSTTLKSARWKLFYAAKLGAGQVVESLSQPNGLRVPPWKLFHAAKLGIEAADDAAEARDSDPMSE